MDYRISKVCILNYVIFFFVVVFIFIVDKKKIICSVIYSFLGRLDVFNIFIFDNCNLIFERNIKKIKN